MDQLEQFRRPGMVRFGYQRNHHLLWFTWALLLLKAGLEHIRASLAAVAATEREEAGPRRRSAPRS